jgi:hypothetical protein
MANTDMPTLERMRGQAAQIVARSHNRDESAGSDASAGYPQARD